MDSRFTRAASVALIRNDDYYRRTVHFLLSNADNGSFARHVTQAMTTKKPTRQEQTAIAEVQLGRGRRPQARKLRDAKDAMYREHIMEVAERIFADQGFANTKMQDIAAVAGISLGTLYQSYES